MSRKVTTISDRIAMERCLSNMVKDQLKRIKELKAENERLKQHLKYNTKQVCEKIIDIANKEFNCCGYIEDIEFDKFRQKLLDQIDNIFEEYK